MGTVVYAREVLDRYASVSLRRSNARMAEHLLNRSEIGSMIKQMTCERMPQAMGVNRSVADESHGIKLDDVSSSSIAQATAAMV